ncbi:PrsW family intramembrane metalloprotease [Halocalculus aciditolerans]|uniref:PrsW family intramembrane metalloprotease n=1 Tax=Halocalculus aciditolerans TaxID=1383812 RepID=A0A830FNC5_9EURY|nr:PrsW family glutamic-type intramembrane protease [Halocalculus aciditolerans]GGL70034.1 PrsW family intramembrane metalloprotease [Halocalculus aciditolerans]
MPDSPDAYDPVRRAAADDADLYDVADWEDRSIVDHVATRLHAFLTTNVEYILAVVAVLILAAQFAIVGVAAVSNPFIAVFTVLSVIPAFFLALVVWKIDVTIKEPLDLMVVTFLLGFLFAGFAAVVNTMLQGVFQVVPLVGMVLFFFLVVGPVEETVKWLAVRLYAYDSPNFDSVVDGAVYGAIAGLGFATVENFIYITRPALQAASTGGGQAALQAALDTAAVRLFAGPGHVIYSAFAGYYLGLAKFNPGKRGPIVVKGLLVAAVIHATYNSLVGHVGVLTYFLPIGGGVAYLLFVFVYDGVFFYILYRKLARYREKYREYDAGRVDDDFDGLTPAVERVD